MRVRATGIAPTLQRALEDWSNVAPRLNALSDALNAGSADGAFDAGRRRSSPRRCRAPTNSSTAAPTCRMSRACARARGAEVPESFYTDPLMYQATSAGFIRPARSGARDRRGLRHRPGSGNRRRHRRRADGGRRRSRRASHIQLVGLVNDVSLRNLIPGELAKGFGFLQSKPRSALSPVFVTPDELGDAWRGNKLHLPLLTHINGAWFGAPEAGVDMQFDFAQLVAHAAKTRPLSAGTIVGSGTIANEDTSKGASCFAEKRTVETLAARQAADAVPVVRRPGAHRDAGCRGRQHLRRDRAARSNARPTP